MIPATDSPAFQPSPLSEVLTGIANRWDQPRISVADLMAALGERGLIGLLLILAIINIIPNLPGTSAVLGLPMLYLSWQMMRGGIPWLPRFVAMRSFDTGQFRGLIIRAMPHLKKGRTSFAFPPDFCKFASGTESPWWRLPAVVSHSGLAYPVWESATGSIHRCHHLGCAGTRWRMDHRRCAVRRGHGRLSGECYTASDACVDASG